MKRLNKKGLSPVVATVLLIAMVVVIGLIIFLWFRNISGEYITKSGQNVETICNEIDFEASYTGGILYIRNNANIAIYGMKVKIIESDGSYETKDLEDIADPFKGLNAGQNYSSSISVGSAEEIVLIPVLRGTTDEGEKTYVCDENVGFSILI